MRVVFTTGALLGVITLAAPVRQLNHIGVGAVGVPSYSGVVLPERNVLYRIPLLGGLTNSLGNSLFDVATALPIVGPLLGGLLGGGYVPYQTSGGALHPNLDTHPEGVPTLPREPTVAVVQHQSPAFNLNPSAIYPPTIDITPSSDVGATSASSEPIVDGSEYPPSSSSESDGAANDNDTPADAVPEAFKPDDGSSHATPVDPDNTPSDTPVTVAQGSDTLIDDAAPSNDPSNSRSDMPADVQL